MNAVASRPSIDRERWVFASISLVCILTYFNTLGNGFVNFDDAFDSILKNPYLSGWTAELLQQAFTQSTAGYYDPIYILSYAIDYQLWGLNPAGFHFDNALLHTLNTFLFFNVLLRLTGGGYAVSLLAALLFAVHPVHVESVSWATSRKDVLSLFFALGSFLLYLRGVSGSTVRFAFHLAGSILFLALGMMIKPSIAVLPVLILLADVLLFRERRRWSRVLAFQSLSFLVLGSIIGLTLNMAMGQAVKSNLDFSPQTHLILFFDLYRYFLKLIFFPLNLNAFYLIPVRETVPLWTAAGYVLSFCLLAWGSVHVIKRLCTNKNLNPRTSLGIWGIAVYLVGLFPFTNVLPRGIYLADRYEYLASLGFCTSAAVFLMAMKNPAWKMPVAALTLLLFAALCIHRVPVWKDSPTLWADINSKRNISPSAHHRVMADAYAFDGRWQLALKEYEQVGIETIRDPDTLLRVSNVSQSAGRDDLAVSVIEKILQENPAHIPAMSGLLVLHIRKKEYGHAEERLRSFRDRMPASLAKDFHELIQLDKNGDLESARETYLRVQAALGKLRNHVQG